MKKKELMDFVNKKIDQFETFRLNNICQLFHDNYYNIDGSINESKGDVLILEFDNINGVCFSIYDREIKSRDYEGIKAECVALIERFLDEVKRSLTSDLMAGYRNKE